MLWIIHYFNVIKYYELMNYVNVKTVYYLSNKQQYIYYKIELRYLI